MEHSHFIQKNLFELLFTIQEKMRDVLKGTDARISPVQILILRALVEHGPLPQHRIAATLSKDKSQIARLIKGLEAKGAIDRRRSPTDGRVYIVSARAHVEAKIAQIIEHEKKLITDLLQDVDVQDREVFNRVLEIMLKRSRS